MVLQSITSVPWDSMVSRPSSPKYSDSTCLLAGSIEMTISAASTAAAADAAMVTPGCPAAFAQASELRSKAWIA